MSKNIGRRKFLGMAGIGLGTAGLTAFTSKTPNAGGNDRTIPNPAPGGPQQDDGGVDWQEIDRSHQEQVELFLENIGQDDLFWRPPLDFTMSDDGYKVFELTCQEVEWETEPGSVFPAFGYNGIVPGPQFRLTEGDKVRINVTNEMNESTGIHFHGVRTPNDQDGIPFITQPAIEPGTTFTYEFDIINSGSHMYHSHHNAAEQVIRGLLGPIVIDPADTSREPEVDGDYIMVLNDSGLGYTINGKSFPYTQPILAKLGDRIRIRYMNEGLMIHPMHLHGMPQLVFAKDGYALPQPYLADNVMVAPGDRVDVLVDCDVPGVWAFHCHILTHAESRRGLYGMTTALVVEE